MSTTSVKKYTIVGDDRNTVISNQEAISSKWKFTSLFAVISGIIYGFFFGMLPATFIFNGSLAGNESNPPIFEICAIIGLLLIGSLSLGLIFWTFRGDFKKKHPVAYSLTHILNAILLVVGIVVVTILQETRLSTNLNRYLILAICYGGWGLLMAIWTFALLAIWRKQFPLSWAKTPFVIVTFILMAIVELMVYLCANVDALNGEVNFTMNDQRILFAILALVIFILAVGVFGFGIVYIERFKDVLLADRTEYEINSIRDWESIRVFSIVMSSIMVLTYCVAMLIKSAIDFDWGVYLLVEIIVDAVLVLSYIIVIAYVKSVNRKHNAKNKVFIMANSKLFKSIDNSLLLDVFGWVILVKTALIEWIAYADKGLEQEMMAMIAAISFGSLFILYAFNLIVNANIPNLKNTFIALPIVVFALILGIFVVLFGGYLYKPEASGTEGVTVQLSRLVFPSMSILLLIGLSISLIVKICKVSRIFANNAIDENYVDNSKLRRKQKSEKIDLIGQRTRTTEIDADNAKRERERELRN